MEIRSGRRKQIRLELDREIFKKFSIEGGNFIGAKLVDLSHYGMGVLFDDGVSGLLEDRSVEFSLKFDDVNVRIKGVVRHAGSKFVGIEFLKIKTNSSKFFEYLDSKIIRKFHIPTDPGLRGLLLRRVDLKVTLFLLVLEAFLIFAGFFLYRVVARKMERFEYLQGASCPAICINFEEVQGHS